MLCDIFSRSLLLLYLMVLQLFLVFEEPPAPHHQINQRIGEYLLKSYDALKICARLFKNDNKTSISL